MPLPNNAPPNSSSKLVTPSKRLYFKTSSIICLPTNELSANNNSKNGFNSRLDSELAKPCVYDELISSPEAKGDIKIRQIAAQVRDALNNYRTHLRKNYPEEYNKVKSFLNDVTEFNKFSKKTIIYHDEEIPYFINEYWTAKQRMSSNLHEISYRACFKPQLPEFFIQRLTEEGDFVYDPFMGSGTTGIAAKEEGFDFVGCMSSFIGD